MLGKRHILCLLTLVQHPLKTEGALVFRPLKFKTAFIVSEEVKAALERVGNLGVSFERVTGPHD
jgi:hypothetical protein